MNNLSVSTQKKQLRQVMSQQYLLKNEAEYNRWNERIQQRFYTISEIVESRVLFFYYSINYEVNTRLMISKMLERGKTVALPVCMVGNDLQAKVIQEINQLTSTKFGLFEPNEETLAISENAIDVAIIPGVAFDLHGNRLGHGSGYYDRFLKKAKKIFKIGLAYDFQIVDQVPVESWDQRLDALLTPCDYYQFK